MSQPIVTLRPLTRTDLAAIAPAFEDPDTRRYLGGPDWPAAMLNHSKRAVGETFRGATQTAAHHYLAQVSRVAVGYIDCGTFDRATVYGGEGPDGPIITETIEVATGSIAFAVDPAARRRGVSRAMIAAMLAAAGFCMRSPDPDYEGMLYYRTARPQTAPTVIELRRAGLERHRLSAVGYSMGTTFQPSWMDWPMLFSTNPLKIPVV